MPSPLRVVKLRVNVLIRKDDQLSDGCTDPHCREWGRRYQEILQILKVAFRRSAKSDKKHAL